MSLNSETLGYCAENAGLITFELMVSNRVVLLSSEGKLR